MPYVEIALLGLLIVLSVILLTGKGAFLVAGYNTASKEQKAQYDEKKLSRAAGVMLSVVTVATGLLLSGLFTGEAIEPTASYCVLLLAVVAVGMVYMHTECKIKPQQNCVVVGMGTVVKSPELLEENRKKRTVLIISIAIAAVVLGGILLSMVFAAQPTVYTVKNDALKIDTMFGETIPLSDIQSMSIKNAMPDNLEKTNGLGLGTILKGQFAADGQSMNVYVDTAHPPFLYLNTKDGLIIVNGKDSAATIALYKILRTAAHA